MMKILAESRHAEVESIRADIVRKLDRGRHGEAELMRADIKWRYDKGWGGGSVEILNLLVSFCIKFLKLKTFLSR